MLVPVPVEDPTRRLNNLAVARTFEFGRHRTEQRVLFKSIHVVENTLNKLARSGGIFYRDVIRNGIEIGKSRLSPNYFSHRDNLALASFCVSVLPSSSASSPRAIPSNKFIRD